jgi:hypothetical protein
MVTVWAALYVPVPGLNVGVAAGGKFMVYAAEPAALSVYPVAIEIAFTVSVAETVIGTEYAGELVVGVDPFVV